MLCSSVADLASQLREEIQRLERRQPIDVEPTQALQDGVGIWRGVKQTQLTLRGCRRSTQGGPAAALKLVLFERAQDFRGPPDDLRRSCSRK